MMFHSEENMTPSKLMSNVLFIYFFTNFAVVNVGSIVSHESQSAEMSFSSPLNFFSSLKSPRHNLRKRNIIILTKNNYDKDDDEMMGDSWGRGGREVLSANVREVTQRRERRVRKHQDDFDLKNVEKEDGFKSFSKLDPVILSSSSSFPSSSCSPGPIPFLPFSQQSKPFETSASSAKTYLSSSPSLSSSSSSPTSLGSSEFHGLQNILTRRKWIQKITSSPDDDVQEQEKEYEHGQRSLAITRQRKVPKEHEEFSKRKQGDRTSRHDDTTPDGDEDQDNIPSLLRLSGSKYSGEEEDISSRLKSFSKEKSRNVEESFSKLFPRAGNEMRMKKNKSITVSSARERKKRGNPRLLSRQKRFFLSGTFQLPSLFLEVLSMMRKS